MEVSATLGASANLTRDTSAKTTSCHIVWPEVIPKAKSTLAAMLFAACRRLHGAKAHGQIPIVA